MTELFNTQNRKKEVDAQVTSIKNGIESLIDVREVYFQDNGAKEILVGVTLEGGQRLALRFNKK